MEKLAKETIIIVHGTWASPGAGKDEWYLSTKSPEGFVARLDAALEKRGSAARCWAHCREGGNEFFHWSGENNWISRTRAAEKLGNDVAKLSGQGWVCHLVAHSHGGNVILEALRRITDAQAHLKQPWRIVTLGTPFMDVVTPVLDRDKTWQEMGVYLSLMLIGFSLPSVIELAYREPFKTDTFGVLFVLMLFLGLIKGRWEETWASHVNWGYSAVEATFWLSAGIFARITFRQLPHTGRVAIGLAVVCGILVARAMAITRIRAWLDKGARQTLNSPEHEQIHPRLLIIGSRMDEAWQLLHHLRNSDNPLAVTVGFARYLLSSFRSAVEQRKAMHRLYYGSYSLRVKLGILAAYLIAAYSAYSSFNYNDIYVLRAEIRVLGISALWPVLFPPIGYFLMAGALLTVKKEGRRIFAGLLLPFRWSFWILASLATVFPATGTYAVRRASWPVFLRLALGLEGYRLNIPLIEQYPRNINAEFLTYKNIPPEAEAHALKNRSAWIESHILDVSQTFSKTTVGPTDISALLSTIEANQTLVHATYYTDDRCIAQIADWLAENTQA